MTTPYFPEYRRKEAPAAPSAPTGGWDPQTMRPLVDSLNSLVGKPQSLDFVPDPIRPSILARLLGAPGLAAGQYQPGSNSITISRAEDPTSSQMQTLPHEYGHKFFDRGQVPAQLHPVAKENPELSADRFASALALVRQTASLPPEQAVAALREGMHQQTADDYGKGTFGGANDPQYAGLVSYFLSQPLFQDHPANSRGRSVRNLIGNARHE